MIYLGIDPGNSGGLATIATNAAGEVTSTWATKMPETERELFDTLCTAASGLTKCVIEAVQAFPGQGRSSIFTFGKNYGLLLGMLTAAQIPHLIVSPRKWQGALGIAGRGKIGNGSQKDQALQKRLHKNKLKQHAERIFPKMKITLATADAILIAEFCRRFEAEIPA